MSVNPWAIVAWAAVSLVPAERAAAEELAPFRTQGFVVALPPSWVLEGERVASGRGLGRWTYRSSNGNYHMVLRLRADPGMRLPRMAERRLQRFLRHVEEGEIVFREERLGGRRERALVVARGLLGDGGSYRDLAEAHFLLRDRGKRVLATLSLAAKGAPAEDFAALARAITASFSIRTAARPRPEGQPWSPKQP